MIRRIVASVAASALLIPLAPVAFAADPSPDQPTFKAETATRAAGDKGTVLSLGKATGSELYIVQLETPAVPSRATAGEKGLRSADTDKAHRALIQGEQADLRASIRRITGATPKVRHTYTEAVNGIAVVLTRAQALKVSRLEGVSAVQVDEQRELTTDVGPEWIGAPSIWDGSSVPGGDGTKGEGVIVGVLDSGINPANPSFADTVPAEDGGDGYNHTNPFGAGNYVGMCDPASDVYVEDWGCNDKLIGYWNMTTDGSTYDDDGHGTHTASTAAGNQVEATTYAAEGTEHEFSVNRVIKGVAPHANVIAYDVCDGGCSMAAITAGIDQAILDEVDAINYSIGSDAASSPWTDPDALGFLNARAAGIHVATSAGNDGPGAETVGSPADVPWLTSVGATQHNRQWQAELTDLAADGGATHPDISGVAFAAATDGSFPIVDAADLGDALCQAAELGDQDLTGKIVICTRGGNGRVEKGEVVAALGAEGMVLANNEASGDSLNADPHALPAVHITYDDAVELRTWLASVTGETAALSGGLEHIGDDVADIMAAFSSRGANRAVSMISPSVSAPGVDVLAGEGVDNEVKWGFISGTSMASPHTAGSLALLAGAHPDWTPAQAQSALMTTAVTDITDDDGTEATWFDMGSGRVDLTKAANAGLLLDVTEAEYLGADPAVGGDVRALNTASMADNQCLQTCSWTRTVEGTSTGAGEWTVTTESDSADLTLSVDVADVTVTDGGTADIVVTAEIADGVAADEWLNGTVVLTPPDGSDAPVAHLPVAVLPSTGVLPESVDITTRRDAGSWLTTGLEAISFDELQIQASGLVPEQRETLTVPLDTTNDDAWDGNGTELVEFTVPADASSLIIGLENSTAPDFDLFVGYGAVEEGNVLCASASGGSAESCEIANPEAGTWWALVQNWESSAAGTDTVDIVSAIVAGDPGNLWAEGPDGPVGAGDPFDLRTFWNEKQLDAGETWHGTLTLGTQDAAGNIGVVPVTVHRIEDDVTKTADVATAKPGDVVTYTVEVAPNTTPEDLTYSITDSLPDGVTYVEGSATDGAVVEDGVLSWTGDSLSSFGDPGSYAITTSATDEECVNPATGDASYLDLEGLGIAAQAGIVGDTTAFTGFTDTTFGFFGDNYSGVSFTDDGFLIHDVDANYDGEPWTPQVLPDAALPNNVAAALWQDMEFRYDEATNAGVSLARGGDLRIVEFDNMRLWGDAGGLDGSWDYQAILVAGSQDIVFAYDNIDGDLPEVTIGAENADASAGNALVNADDASGVITDGTVVCMAYESPVSDPLTFSYQVTVDSTVQQGAVITNKAVHTTDNPGAKTASASDSVEITGVKATSQTGLVLGATQVETGDSVNAHAVVLSTGAAKPTGQVEFRINGTLAGTSTLDSSGKASAVLTAPATAGTYAVSAKYLGDTSTLGSESAPVNVVVTKPGVEPPAKVNSKVTVDAPKTVKVKSKGKSAKISVTASGVTPTGTVTVTIKGGGVDKKLTVSLDSKGRATVKLPKFKKTGTVTVTADYAGDAAVKPGSGKATIKVKPKKK